MVCIGVVIGTFIPMPQQRFVRAAVSAAWNWIKDKTGSFAVPS
ncbi:hypothetical protein RPALISO_29 [Ruegeria phage RpAliso]|nr:hypothetical protein RPALISO_29 [Ruegeria phage RpAliso]